jgi:hypothetical protein
MPLDIPAAPRWFWNSDTCAVVTYNGRFTILSVETDETIDVKVESGTLPDDVLDEVTEDIAKSVMGRRADLNVDEAPYGTERALRADFAALTMRSAS